MKPYRSILLVCLTLALASCAMYHPVSDYQNPRLYKYYDKNSGQLFYSMSRMPYWRGHPSEESAAYFHPLTELAKNRELVGTLSPLAYDASTKIRSYDLPADHFGPYQGLENFVTHFTANAEKEVGKQEGMKKFHGTIKKLPGIKAMNGQEIYLQQALYSGSEPDTQSMQLDGCVALAYHPGVHKIIIVEMTRDATAAVQNSRYLDDFIGTARSLTF